MNGRERRPRHALPVSERDLQDMVLSVAKLGGWALVYHTHDSRHSQPGWPDLVLAHPTRNRILFVELKAQTGRVSLAQRRWLLMLAAVGAEVGVWRPADRPAITRVLGAQQERLVLTPEMLGDTPLPPEAVGAPLGRPPDPDDPDLEE